MSRNNFGRYLYSERIRRKAENISTYVKERQLPISESYYRDIESGRKMLRIDTALSLCESLDLDKNAFFYYLLSDVLAEEVFKALVKKPNVASFDSAGEEIERLQDNVELFTKAYKKQLNYQESFEVDKSTVEYLEKHIEVLPLVHFIYMREECSFAEIKQVMKQNRIRRDLIEIINEFSNLNLAFIDTRAEVIRRHSRYFKIPKTREGLRFKDLFFLSEIKKATEKKRSQHMLESNNSFIHSMILAINEKKGGERIRLAIVDFLAALDAEEAELVSGEAVPFFVSIIVSSREEYNTTIQKEDNKND